MSRPSWAAWWERARHDLDLQWAGPWLVKHLARRVILIDGQRLADLMIEHGVGVLVSRAIELKRLDKDFLCGGIDQ